MNNHCYGCHELLEDCECPNDTLICSDCGNDTSRRWYQGYDKIVCHDCHNRNTAHSHLIGKDR